MKGYDPRYFNNDPVESGFPPKDEPLKFAGAIPKEHFKNLPGDFPYKPVSLGSYDDKSKSTNMNGRISENPVPAKKTTVLEAVVSEMVANNEQQSKVIAEAHTLCADIIHKVGQLYHFRHGDGSISPCSEKKEDGSEPSVVSALQKVSDQIDGNTISLVSLVCHLKDVKYNLEQLV